MADNPDDVTIRDNQAARRYEAQIGDQIARIDYRLMDNRIVLVHTEVPKELEGRGIAGKLARFALEDARARHLVVAPSCPYVASYLRRHPEYLDLVTPEDRERYLQ